MDGLIDTAPCGFLSVDDGGVVRAVNRTLADALGYAPEDLEGRPVRAVLAPGARIYYESHFFPLLRLQGEIHEVYLSLRTRGGEDLPALLNARRAERDGAPLTDLVVVPIERRSRFEDELLEARREAETASQSRARLLSMLSHDVRSPLSAMVMTADLLARGAFGPATEDQADELGRVAEAGRYVLRLVADVLEFSRLESGRVDVRTRPVGVAEAVGRALDLVAAAAAEAGLEVEPPEGPPAAHVRADPDRVQQVLVNLLGNAVKFTDAGGRVGVTWDRDGGRVALHVRDTGRGIDAERLETMFAPFVQGAAEGGRPADEGVGLGLAISRELVRAMGGEITAASEVGVGTTFTVRLPEAADDATSGDEPGR